MSTRKYYLIHINRNGIAKQIDTVNKPASKIYWKNCEKPLMKKDDPKSRIAIYGTNGKNPLVDCVIVSNLDGSKDYIVAHTKYKEMLIKNKFNFGR